MQTCIIAAHQSVSDGVLNGPDMYFRGDWTLRVQESNYNSLSTTPSEYELMYLEGKQTQLESRKLFLVIVLTAQYSI